MDMMLEKIGNLNNIEVSYGETDILLSFKLKGEDFQFKLNPIPNSMEIESLEYTMYMSEEADIICKAVAADGYISGNIIYKGLSIDKKFDQEFSFIIDKRFAENSAVDEYLDLLKSDSNIKNQIEKNNKLKDEAIDNVYDPAVKISNERGVIANTRTRYSGHVHASAISTSPYYI